MKEIKSILSPPGTHMVGDGFKVHNFFPSGYRIAKEMSPFYLLDYNSKQILSPSKQQRGVGPHPHRGFETVTIAYHGKIAHHDNAGNSGIISEGDVQWMTAGSGVLHKEYHEKEFSLRGGPFQMVQLWVNLPAKYKMTKPKYQEILNSKMGKYFFDDKKSYVDVIAGKYKDTEGPADTFTEINLYNIHLKHGMSFKTIVDTTHSTGVLIINGKIDVNGKKSVPKDHFVLFSNSGKEIIIDAIEDSTILFLSGERINEPIAQYGPFLMNTHDEINKAIQDFNSGKFGYLED